MLRDGGEEHSPCGDSTLCQYYQSPDNTEETLLSHGSRVLVFMYKTIPVIQKIYLFTGGYS